MNTNKTLQTSFVFGGSGFIGVFFAKSLLNSGSFEKVYIFDLVSPCDKASEFRKRLIAEDSRIVFIEGDVRKAINWVPSETISLIANFAAVHREPGHKDFEYYETNLLGAENICSWAEKVDCQRIIFTSSISPYGPSEQEKTEASLPVPTTAYGGSKLVAEKIHQTWQARNSEIRQLIITRPGVVFGPGEGGNVSRLIKAVLHRYFFYTGNKNTRKAGTYVKELCNAILWVLARQDQTGERVNLFNMSMNPGPSIQEYVDTVCKVANVTRTVPSIPYPLLLAAAYTIDLVARPLGVRHPFSPVRIRKLVRSNNILPSFLVDNGYTYQYNLESALSDWKKDCPEEWT